MNREFTAQDFAGNQEAEQALAILTNSNGSLFLTGKAGAGKSTLLELAKRETGKEIVVVAPTAVAANNVNGVTIHSFFQLPPHLIFSDSDKMSDIKYSKEKRAIMERMEMLIIDEISMVPAYLLDCMDYLLQRVRGKGKPFGGVQMLYVGDPWQLAPIVTRNDLPILKSKYRSAFFFDAEAFKKYNPFKIELKVSYRQTEDTFREILDTIRSEKDIRKMVALLNDNCYRDLSKEIPSENDDTIIIGTTNKTVNSINAERLDDIELEEHCFEAEVTGRYNVKESIAEMELTIKIGARVMLIKNDPDKNYINGSLGTIKAVSEDNIVVLLDDKRLINVGKAVWEQFEHKIVEGKIVTTVKGTMKQFPIKLAWALTVHKCQGLTFDRVHFMTGNIFAEGQAYVALSRCRTIAGLSLSQPLSSWDIMKSASVERFYKSIGSDLEKKKVEYLIARIEKVLAEE